MTIAVARKFVQRVLWDGELVRQVNAAPDQAAVQQLLGRLDLSFNYLELEESCNHLLTQCQSREEAEAIKEIKLWWDCLGGAMNRQET